MLTLEKLIAELEHLEIPKAYEDAPVLTSKALGLTLDYMANIQGLTGNQFYAAVFLFVKDKLKIDGPARLMVAEDFLYPQTEEFEYKKEWGPWLAKEAKNRLKKYPNSHPDVLAHWRLLSET